MNLFPGHVSFISIILIFSLENDLPEGYKPAKSHKPIVDKDSNASNFSNQFATIPIANPRTIASPQGTTGNLFVPI